MASENNTDSHIYETNMNVVKRRIAEFWNRRFLSSNLVVDSPEEPQTSRQSKANSSVNSNTETETDKPKKRTYHKQLESDEIIAEKVKLIQRGDIATLIKNEKTGKYKEKLSVPAKKSCMLILNNDKAPPIPKYLLGKSFHKNHLHHNKCDENKQPIEVSSNDNGGPHIKSNLSEEHDEVIKIKEQLLELSCNTSESSSLKRNSSEKDEKIIKKSKVSSEVSVSNMNELLPAVSVVEIDEISEKEIEVTHDTNTNTLDQYNALSFKSPKSWYTSDTINDYLKLIVKRSNGEVHSVVTDFIPAYLRGGYPAVRRWIKKDIHSFKLLFVPMNVYGEHWILTVVNVPEKTVTSYDSLKSYDGPYPMVLKEYLTDWEMDKKGAASSWILKIGETTRQTNGYDCGPFTVELAEKMARGDTTPINASLMPSVRLRHREEIIAGQLFL
ncbi:uncharacterized protein LOC126904063 [Daktulosphaira vitifoliae]|uniref:uncharacterized protein LOC126904063 n=1 Tax=Daktulosphaira vitifoliae TaxID=58002 RepID=UPI0021AAB2F3|nr:uncharacterized protein LOC126904063 [Daktulosphaira vitifoliae]